MRISVYVRVPGDTVEWAPPQLSRHRRVLPELAGRYSLLGQGRAGWDRGRSQRLHARGAGRGWSTTPRRDRPSLLPHLPGPDHERARHLLEVDGECRARALAEIARSGGGVGVEVVGGHRSRLGALLGGVRWPGSCGACCRAYRSRRSTRGSDEGQSGGRNLGVRCYSWRRYGRVATITSVRARRAVANRRPLWLCNTSCRRLRGWISLIRTVTCVPSAAASLT